MTQYTYLPRLSMGLAPAFATAGAVLRVGISRMTREPVTPLVEEAFFSAVLARRAVRREGFGLGGIRLSFQHRLDLFHQALRKTRLGAERVAAGIHGACGV